MRAVDRPKCRLMASLLRLRFPRPSRRPGYFYLRVVCPNFGRAELPATDGLWRFSELPRRLFD
jgi:hypothetical protein